MSQSHTRKQHTVYVEFRVPLRVASAGILRSGIRIQPRRIRQDWIRIGIFAPTVFDLSNATGRLPRQGKKIKSSSQPLTLLSIAFINRIASRKRPYFRPAEFHICSRISLSASGDRIADRPIHVTKTITPLFLSPSGKAPGQTNNNKATAPYERFRDSTARNTD